MAYRFRLGCFRSAPFRRCVRFGIKLGQTLDDALSFLSLEVSLLYSEVKQVFFALLIDPSAVSVSGVGIQTLKSDALS